MLCFNRGGLIFTNPLRMGRTRYCTTSLLFDIVWVGRSSQHIQSLVFLLYYFTPHTLSSPSLHQPSSSLTPSHLHSVYRYRFFHLLTYITLIFSSYPNNVTSINIYHHTSPSSFQTTQSILYPSTFPPYNTLFFPSYLNNATFINIY